MLLNHPYIDMVIDNANVATKEEKDAPCTNRLHYKREEILVAYLGYLSHFDLFYNEPRSEFLTTIRTMKIFNVTVVVGGGGDHPPEFRAPIRRRRASMI